MRAVLSWSSGKDAAWALHTLRGRGVEPVELVTTVDGVADRVAMHGVRQSVLEAQAEAVGLPLRTVGLPWPCSNDAYEARVRAALADARAAGATHVAFGDLFLEDVRAYRERLLDGTGLQPLFPLWHPPGGTAALARAMLAGGLRATVVCVDPAQVSPDLVGRPYDEAFLTALPAGADPCGERGEFHTLCHGGPPFRQPLAVGVGEAVERGGFWFTDVMARPARP